jgi:hypothetical protein
MISNNEPLFRHMAMHTNTVLQHQIAAPQLKQPPVQSTIFQPKVSQSTPLENGWKSPTLTRMSRFHPLENFHCAFPHGEYEAVLKQLETTFRVESFNVQFQATPVQAVCETMDQVRFCVSVWELDANDIVVEVQRMCGDGRLFAGHARTILECKSSPPPPPPPPAPRAFGGGSVTPVPPRPVQSMLQRCSVPPVPPQEHDADLASACDVAQQMLYADRYDSRLLGLQSLACLTNPWQTHQNSASAFLAQDSKLADMVLSLALHQSWPAHAALPEAPPDTHTYLALVVLAQVLQQVNPDTTAWLQPCLEKHAMLECLLHLVESAPTQPHFAYHAVLCLEAIYKVKPHLSIPKLVIEQALNTGCSRHKALETAAEKLLQVL